ncbi:hypothetical protein [Cyclobacterium amurskyense]|jgi:hypothetical protein|uniref:Uncharacterized protein n=1 Tax=Cyclobacterium amurskyense TaxID=320787 RepID=A0A0H4P9B4_9BACT|nr:hypothetical protein [Cyclobacterium amurskyense]AKP51056.1 hypothetical protein CA2015_1620 [Cyclobacterium amurskyense]|tara:strand:- start:1899 stop:2189 length:291 start_codon:yes stop_codon:yes gene_type:complete
MTFLYIVYVLFVIHVIVGFKIYFKVSALLKKHKLSINKQSISLRYSVKELSQLIDQSDSEEVNLKINQLIRWTKLNYWLGRISFLLFVGIAYYLFF